MSNQRRNTIAVDSNALKAAREAKGMTQETLANKSGYSKETISRIERGHSTYLSVLRIIAETLGVEITTLQLKNSKTSDETSRKGNADGLILISDSVRDNVRDRIRNEALNHFKMKLFPKSTDGYIPLGLECSVFRTGEGHSGTDHGRIWKGFDKVELINPQGTYILSSDTGTGKTTYLRFLQLEYLDQKQLLPIYIHASRLEGKIPLSKGGLKSCLIESVDLGDLYGGFEVVLGDAIANNKLLLLVDGLDQIRGVGSEYQETLNELTKAYNGPLIIASRPFAVISHERNPDIRFLRLKPFNQIQQKSYFGDSYDRGCEICIGCRELLSIPMLAYIVRELVDNRKDKGIKNRTAIYDRFINYVLDGGYNHDNLHWNEDQRAGVRSILGSISYSALALHSPHIQKIPRSFCYEHTKNHKVTIDTLPKYGMVSLIAEMSKGIEKYLFFTHQSFQEYLAAEYVSQSDDLIHTILQEVWHPKWKEVIRFLVGIKGQVIIKTILTQEDNPIHSRLFTVAELIRDADNVDTELANELKNRVEALLHAPPFNEDAFVHLYYFDPCRIQNNLKLMLMKCDGDSFNVAINTLVRLQEHLDVKEYLKILVDRIGDERLNGRVMIMLNKFRSFIDDSIFSMIEAKRRNMGPHCPINIKYILDDDIDFFCNSIEEDLHGFIDDKKKGLRNMSQWKADDTQDEKVIDAKMASDIIELWLDHGSTASLYNAIYSLHLGKEFISHQLIRRIIAKLKNKASCEIAAEILEEIHDLINDDEIKLISDILSNKDEDVRGYALDVLEDIIPRSEYATQCVIRKLYDESVDVRIGAVTILSPIMNKLEANVIEMIYNVIIDDLIEDEEHISDLEISTLESFDDNVKRMMPDMFRTKIANILTSKLRSEDKDTFCFAVRSLSDLEIEFDIDPRIIAKKMSNSNPDICCPAMTVLTMSKVIPDAYILNEVVSKANSSIPRIRQEAILTLHKYIDILNESMINQLINIKHSCYQLLKDLYSRGKL